MVEHGTIWFNMVSGDDVSTSRQVFVASQVQRSGPAVVAHENTLVRVSDVEVCMWLGHR